MADSLAHASMETHCITLPNERLMSSNETLPGEQSSTKPEIDDPHPSPERILIK